MACGESAGICSSASFESMMCDGISTAEEGGCSLTGDCRELFGDDATLAPRCIAGAGCAPFPAPELTSETDRWAKLTWVEVRRRSQLSEVVFRDDGLVLEDRLFADGSRSADLGVYQADVSGDILMAGFGERDWTLTLDPTATYGVSRDHATFVNPSTTLLMRRAPADAPVGAFAGYWTGPIVLTGPGFEDGTSELALSFDSGGELVEASRHSIPRGKDAIETYKSDELSRTNGHWELRLASERKLDLRIMLGARGEVLLGQVQSFAQTVGFFILTRDDFGSPAALPGRALFTGQGPADYELTRKLPVLEGVSFWVEVVQGNGKAMTFFSWNLSCTEADDVEFKMREGGAVSLALERAGWNEQFQGWYAVGSMQAPIAPFLVFAPLPMTGEQATTRRTMTMPSVMVWRPELVKTPCP